MCLLCDHFMCTEVGGNPCRIFSLLGFAHPLWNPPFRYKSSAGGWPSYGTAYGIRAGHGFVLFCFCLVLYLSRTKTCTPFWYQRDCKETVIIVYHIFLYIVN